MAGIRREKLSALCHNEGDGTFARVTEGEIATRWGGFPSGGDYDDDGFLDLLLSNGALDHVQFRLAVRAALGGA